MTLRFALAAASGLLAASPALAQPAPATPPAASANPALPTISGPVLRVSDMARTVKFLTEGMGLVVVRSGNLTVLAAAASGPPPIIMLQQAPTGPGTKPFAPGDGFVRMYMAATDTAALTARLKAAGYAPYTVPNELPGVIFVKDPDGYLYEITPPNAGRRGR